MFTLPKLSYSYSALEPYIDTDTMMIHHSRHHQAYVNSLNDVIQLYIDQHKEECANIHDTIVLSTLLYGINGNMTIDESIKSKLKNYGGGHYNHSFFWRCMSPVSDVSGTDSGSKSDMSTDSAIRSSTKDVSNGSTRDLGSSSSGSKSDMSTDSAIRSTTHSTTISNGSTNMSNGSTSISSNGMSKELCDTLQSSFGSFDNFISSFTSESLRLFGSGWTWLVYDKCTNSCTISTTVNQDNPMMDCRSKIPLLCLDVWEHAYYLKYKNNRKEYITKWYNVVDWTFVSQVYTECVLNGKEVVMMNDGSVLFE